MFLIERNGGLLQSSSKGSQPKYYRDGYWYKGDTHNESLAECICCRYLDLLQFEYPLRTIMYAPFILNKVRGCVAEDFRKLGRVRTFYRLLLKGYTKEYLRQFDNDPQREYKILVQEMNKYNVNAGYYITELFLVDALIRNSDRHTNNMAFLETNNVYSFAPLFDNGEALFVSKSKGMSAVECLNKYREAKPFGMTYDDQLQMAMHFFPVQVRLLYTLLDLTMLDLSIYDPEIVKRAVSVLQITTQHYFKEQLMVKI